MEEDTKKAIEEAQRNLFMSYLQYIDNRYQNQPGERSNLLRGIEAMIERCDKVLEMKSTKVFDNGRACDIRQKLGLTQGELAKQLGIERTWISRQERGAALIPERSPFWGVYHDWLKEHGYNPIE